jgi:hypothetical protein
MIRIALIAAALGAAGPALAQGDPLKAEGSLLRVTQIDQDDQQVDPPQETRCPDNGCQLPSVLRLGADTLALQTVVTFAGQGIYVVLESPGTGAQVHLYGDPRPAPLFLPKTPGTIRRTVHIAIDRPVAGRPSVTRQLAAQEAYLRIEISPPQPIPAG